jgi:hypothetical protein
VIGIEQQLLHSCMCTPSQTLSTVCFAAQDMEAAQLMQQADAISPASSGGHAHALVGVTLAHTVFCVCQQ